MRTVFLNGQFLPESEAMVSPLDRGFLFGDGVYEVIPVYGRRPFRLACHLGRLTRSLSGVRIRPPFDDVRWAQIIGELVDRNAGEDQSVYLQVTRGVARRDHSFPAGIAPTVFAMTTPLAPVPEAFHREGIAAITLADTRWEYCHLKTTALLPNVLLRQQALDAGATEAILIRDGEVTEGAASNVFAVIGGTVVTPPQGPRLLPGITRDVILELARHERLPLSEAPISEGDLKTADEVWLTSSTREILPVTRVDDQPIGSGRPGPVWLRMIASYQAYKRAHRAGTI